jgi:hypothetical protein
VDGVMLGMILVALGAIIVGGAVIVAAAIGLADWDDSRGED